LVAPFLYNNPKAWKRRDKPHVEQVEQLIKSVYKISGGENFEKRIFNALNGNNDNGTIGGRNNKTSSDGTNSRGSD